MVIYVALHQTGSKIKDEIASPLLVACVEYYSGNPIVYSSFVPQPVNTDYSAVMAKQTIPRAQTMK